ncbi:hypothetical protein SAMN04515675_3926 [Pseudomonas costantinii]|uniref:Uncharacterized protein n=1 Tax=Pseudomonas costantinii TaxID=168469 RepID=A0A1S2V9M5_9PSED|nr:hypothetical protein BFL40_04935 [Pseudomonas costantinii]OIN54705.1 hypothetical protein BFL40_02220 [Pseudomonas costantinii]OIN55369.1 hypothetical protein BFL40_01330 [Pseudomonas costantinii]SEE09660.1 hypothetical protein SAMN04515675_3926 [Pseudomonas costantinii]
MGDGRTVYMYCVGVLAILVVIVFLAQVYIAYFKVDEIFKCLGSCKLVSYRKGFVGSSFFGRVFFVNAVSGMFVFQRIHINDGAVTREELESVPCKLMRELRLWGFFLMLVGVYAITLWVVGKYMGWIK